VCPTLWVHYNPKEIKELKAELKSHLQEAVHELIVEGKSEQEAIEIAIERFGGEKEMHNIVSELFRVQKTFAKKVLYTAIIFLFIGLISFGFIYLNELKKENIREDLIMSDILHELDASKVNPENEEEYINKLNSTKRYIEKLVQEYPGVYEITLWDDHKLSSVSSNEEYQKIKPEIQVKKDVWMFMTAKTGYGLGNENWDVNLTYISYRPLADNILLLGSLIYIVLFTVWAIINAYHHRRLNIGWIIVFALFNVIGYLVYILFGKRVQSKTII
jgi:hypothetical protein